MKQLDRNHHINNQRGDTIVEVLICLMIIGLAIGIGYGIASRSLKAARQAQERTEAVKIAEGQVERIKGVLAGVNTAEKDKITDQSTNVFCMNSSGAVVTFPGAYGTTIKNLDSDDLTNYPADCTQGLYKVIIDQDTATPNQFAVVVRWESLGAGKREEVKIKYKVYQ